MNGISQAERMMISDLWQRLGAMKVVMLGTSDGVSPFRPMHPFAAEEECAIWFFIRRSSGWRNEVGEGVMAHLIFVEGGTYGDVLGRLEVSTSATHVERYWSPQVSALYARGRNDPDIVLLRFTPQVGHLWTSSGGILTAGLEIVLAGLIGDLPGTPLAAEQVRFGESA
jgi:general stress protein 26